MPKPDKDNLFVKRAINTWHFDKSGYSFCLFPNYGTNDYDEYSVRVFPHDDREAYWLENGPFETESGAVYMAFCHLEDLERN